MVEIILIIVGLRDILRSVRFGAVGVDILGKMYRSEFRRVRMGRVGNKNFVL